MAMVNTDMLASARRNSALESAAWPLGGIELGPIMFSG